jgi:hypothetical protein
MVTYSASKVIYIKFSLTAPNHGFPEGRLYLEPAFLFSYGLSFDRYVLTMSEGLWLLSAVANIAIGKSSSLFPYPSILNWLLHPFDYSL